MNVKKFISDLAVFGLEKFGRYYSVYKGFCVDNNDPDSQGRLKIRVPQIYKDQVPEYWVRPRGIYTGKGKGMYIIPQPGDPLYISFENGDPRFPIWEYGWMRDGDGPDKKDVDIYTFQSPNGNIITIDDKENTIETTVKGGYTSKIYKDGVFLGNNTNSIGNILNDLGTQFAAASAGPYVLNNASEFVKILTEAQVWIKKSK